MREMVSVVKQPCDEGIILSRAADTPCTKTQGRWILAATILASAMAFIDGTVVNIALPFLQKELDATVICVQWVIEAVSFGFVARRWSRSFFDNHSDEFCRRRAG